MKHLILRSAAVALAAIALHASASAVAASCPEGTQTCFSDECISTEECNERLGL